MKDLLFADNTFQDVSILCCSKIPLNYKFRIVKPNVSWADICKFPDSFIALSQVQVDLDLDSSEQEFSEKECNNTNSRL